MFIRLVAPFLLRFLINFFFKKAVRNSAFGQAQQAQQAYQRPPQNQPTGKVKIDYIPEDQQKERKEFAGGEYVDYEEVK